jgi:hypothetical protein
MHQKNVEAKENGKITGERFKNCNRIWYCCFKDYLGPLNELSNKHT